MRMNNDLVIQALLIWHLLYGPCKPGHSPKCLEHYTMPHSPFTENLDNQKKFNGIMQKLFFPAQCLQITLQLHIFTFGFDNFQPMP